MTSVWHPNVLVARRNEIVLFMVLNYECIMKKYNTHNDQLQFSYHARIRQAQRNITDDAVNAVMQSGEQMDWRDTKIYINEDIKVVFSQDSNTVVTVNKNTRNTRFQLSQYTKHKEQSLLYKANVQKDNHAMCELAELYLTGQLGVQNIRKAYRLFEEAAHMGSSHAMCKISELYQNSAFGLPNQELSDRWLKKAADKNNVYALALIGQKLLYKYQENYPIESNIFRPSAPKKEILYYLNKAADKGSTRAIWQLGHIYERGLLGTQDLSKAQELYVKAAKNGSPTSLDSLYKMSLKSYFSAIELEEILDNLSSSLAITSIGMCLQIGTEQLSGNLGYNPVRGFKMIEQAALKDNVQAIKKLARCYREGVGCDMNLKLAQYWFMKLYELYDISAKAGNVLSMWELGKLYLYGNIGNIDLIKAESCFKDAINKSSNPHWIYFLGKLYWEGRLGDKPINIGLQLITQAINIWKLKVQQGDKTVYDNLGDAYYLINSFKNSVYWLSQSSNNDINAQLFLATIYLDDALPEQNIPLGLKILESIILEHNVAALEAFRAVGFTINDQTICWLQHMADSIKQPISEKNSNQYKFQQFIITTLAQVYEKGKLGEVDYKLASKYYYQLFINFENIAAGNKLIVLYHDKHLPTEYYDTVKNWALQIPALITTDKVDVNNFIDCVMLLGQIYQKGNLLSYNIQEATMWLYLAWYFNRTNNINIIQDIEYDLAKLPQLDYTKKEQIVSTLLQITLNIKTTSSFHYKIMSRILGDIFYDNKIINQNIDKAIYWYTESAFKNSNISSLALARIYQHDKQDINASIKWYMSCIQQGDKDALKTLISIADELKLDYLSSFLNRYQHQSLVKESELINIKLLHNLQSYPTTTQEMYELGKYYLNLEDNQNMKLNAAFWFRKAMDRDNIDAAVELYSMYKSGILGINLIPVVNSLYSNILRKCFYQLIDTTMEGTILQNQNTVDILSLLNNISKVLKVGASSNELNEKIETLINQTHNISTKMLKDIVFDLALLLKQEYSSNTIECTISNTLDKINILGEGPDSTSEESVNTSLG
ncbi:hypothetical protein PGB90_008005 [Kerria lacca]